MRLADTVAAYVARAIAIEEEGLEVGPAPDLVLVAELASRLEGDPRLEAAFEALTPGRQREYNMHFAAAKQAKTRNARIDRYRDRILDGKGMRDR